MCLRGYATGFSLLVVLLLVGGRFPTPAQADATDSDELRRARAIAASVESAMVRAVARARAASVAVVSRRVSSASRREGAKRPLPLGSVGSGVLIDWNGTWVLTSLHVVDGQEHVDAVTADARRHRLRLRAVSRRLDLALLAFESRPRDLEPARIKEGGEVRVGEGTWVISTGNPFFLALDGQEAASLGIVSGTRPADANAYIDAPTIQHDAEINPGSSGGPLWNLAGDFLGINGTIATRSRRQGAGPAHTGASFAVPVDAVRRFLKAALGPRHGPIVRRPARGAPSTSPPARAAAAPIPGSLGLRLNTSRDRYGRPTGALVVAVERGAATAGRRGLRPGDVVVNLVAAGRRYAILSASDVEGALSGHAAGTPVSLRFFREGRRRDWSGRLLAR